MSIKIYYFSGTGNSFVVAKDIAEKVKADLISIPKAVEKPTDCRYKHKPDAKAI